MNMQWWHHVGLWKSLLKRFHNQKARISLCVIKSFAIKANEENFPSLLWTHSTPVAWKMPWTLPSVSQTLCKATSLYCLPACLFISTSTPQRSHMLNYNCWNSLSCLRLVTNGNTFARKMNNTSRAAWELQTASHYNAEAVGNQSNIVVSGLCQRLKLRLHQLLVFLLNTHSAMVFCLLSIALASVKVLMTSDFLHFGKALKEKSFDMTTFEWVMGSHA